jgi:drug/metabolite transporter (DMT)-like permease
LPRTSTSLAGIGYAVLAFALFSAMDTVMKWLSGGYPLIQIMFFMNLFGFLVLLPLIARSGGLTSLRPVRLGLLLTRGLCVAVSSLLFFVAFSRLPMADVYSIAFASPLVISAISALFLREALDGRGWAAIAVGFAGVAVMLRPDGGNLVNLGVLSGIGGMLTYCLSITLARTLSRTETPAAMLSWSFAVALAVSGLAMPFDFAVPSAGDFGLLILTGLLYGGGQFAMIAACSRAPTPIVAPFQYSQMIWGILFGFVLFGDKPDILTLAGATVVIATGLYILQRETLRSSMS